LTRGLARQQEENYRKVRQAEAELTQTLRRNPAIEEVAAKTGLRVEQIRNALTARALHFAGALPEAEDPSAAGLIQSPRLERAGVPEALAHLGDRDQQIIIRYYWRDQPHEEIARELGLTPANVSKIRQRALGKLRKRLEGGRKGGQEND
jgi:DNA-directed RNA polymerase specialized sigma subunit